MSYTAKEIEDEVSWERSMLTEGIKNFSEQNDKNVAEGAVGKSIIRKLLTQLVPHFEAHSKSFLTGENAKKKWMALSDNLPFIMVPPEKVAYITLRCSLGYPYDKLLIGKGTTSLASTIGRCIQDEVSFDKWQKASAATRNAEHEAEKAKLIAEGRGGEASKLKKPKSHAEEMIGMAKGHVSRPTVLRWRKTIKELERVAWEPDTVRAVGSTCIYILCEGLPEYFSCEDVRKDDKTYKRLLLSDTLLDMLKETHGRMELNAPLYLPMIVKPKPWRQE